MKTDLMFEGHKVFVNFEGYPCLSHHPSPILLHRLVAERKWGALIHGQHVHHIDGDRMNWCIDNLELMTHAQHRRLHAEERIRKAGGIVGVHLMCTECQLPLPYTAFNKLHSHWSGYQPLCRACKKKIRQHSVK